MSSVSIGCGVLLILVGIVGYIYGLMNGNASVTALIPAFFGIVLAILGAVAGARENLRKHLMHVAVIICLLGFILPAGRLISRIGDLTLSAAVISQIAMALVCLVFVILCVKSFADARRSRTI